jgi:hypothetical protein
MTEHLLMDLQAILNDKKKSIALSELGLACINLELPDLHEVWNLAYPDNPMSFDEGAQLIMYGTDEETWLVLASPDDRSLLLQYLEEAGFPELAVVVGKMIGREADQQA